MNFQFLYLKPFLSLLPSVLTVSPTFCMFVCQPTILYVGLSFHPTVYLYVSLPVCIIVCIIIYGGMYNRLSVFVHIKSQSNDCTDYVPFSLGKLLNSPMMVYHI